MPHLNHRPPAWQVDTLTTRPQCFIVLQIKFVNNILVDAGNRKNKTVFPDILEFTGCHAALYYC